MALERWSDDMWIDRLAGRPGLTDDLDLLTDRYLRRPDPPHLVLDLSAVRGPSSRHLNAMLRLRRHANHTGRRLVLAAPGDGVWSVLLSAELDRAFEYAEDIAAALATLVTS